ncbi:hypothetical protein ACM66B_000261 [Microbotryomycetes sp. NB124-2]
MTDEQGRPAEDPLGLHASTIAARRHQSTPSVVAIGDTPRDGSAIAASSAATSRPPTRASTTSPNGTRQQRSSVSSPPPRPRSPVSRRPQSPPTSSASAGRRSPTATRRDSAAMHGSPPLSPTSNRPMSPRWRGSIASQQQLQQLGQPQDRGLGSTSHVHDVSQDQPDPLALQQFAELCRQLYFDKSAKAAQTIDATLSKLPQHYRTPYAKTMAAVRAQFHVHEQVTKKTAVLETLAATDSGQVVKDVLRVTEGGSQTMRSSVAKTIRRNRLKAFVDEHCIKAMPGTHPFFKSLYCAILLQATASDVGGAGARRVEWQVDLAVFAEASAGSWMKDSIELLKGVLGCTEVQIASSQKAMSEAHVNATAPPAPVSARDRSTSDPFLDPKDRPTKSDQMADPLTPTSPLSPSLTTESPLLPEPNEAHGARSHQTSTADDMRVFTLPSYITDPELLALNRLFPDFITSRTRLAMFVDVGDDGLASGSKPSRHSVVGSQARLPVTTSTSQKVGPHPGHGEVRVSDSVRDPGWRGTLVERFILWIKRLFGLL